MRPDAPLRDFRGRARRVARSGSPTPRLGRTPAVIPMSAAATATLRAAPVAVGTAPSFRERRSWRRHLADRRAVAQDRTDQPAAAGPAVLHRVVEDSDFRGRRERVPAIAELLHHAGRIALEAPGDRLAGPIVGLDLQAAVRIGESPAFDGSLAASGSCRRRKRRLNGALGDSRQRAVFQPPPTGQPFAKTCVSRITPQSKHGSQPGPAIQGQTRLITVAERLPERSE